MAAQLGFNNFMSQKFAVIKRRQLAMNNNKKKSD